MEYAIKTFFAFFEKFDWYKSGTYLLGFIFIQFSLFCQQLFHFLQSLVYVLKRIYANLEIGIKLNFANETHHHNKKLRKSPTTVTKKSRVRHVST